MPVTPRTGPLPSERLATFSNQTVGRLTQGLPSMPQANDPVGGGPQSSPVQLSIQRRMNSIKQEGQAVSVMAQRKALLNQQGMQRVQGQYQRARANTTGQRVSAAPGQQGGMGGVGRAWTADGRLSSSRNSVLADASSYVGGRYVLGGTTRKGIDCSGLVKMVYGKMGISSQHSATWQKNNIPGVRTSFRNLRPGDLVAWKDGSHIAIYAGNGEIIEAANPQRGVVRRRLWANESAVIGIALRLPGE